MTRKKSDFVQLRIDADLKAEAESIFQKLGLSTSQAIKIFFAQVKINKGLPFNVIVNEASKEYKPEKYIVVDRKTEKNILNALNEYKEGRYKVFNGKNKKDLDEFMKNL